MIKYLVIIMVLILFSACSTKDEYVLFNESKINTQETNQEIVTELDNIEFEYKIQAHDRLGVIVYKHPELSTTNLNGLQEERGVLVNSKGDIRLPLIKRIHVAGLTQYELESKLEEAFRVYLKTPDIQIEVLNKRAYVIGEVARPGEITLLNEQLTLLQVLAKAGDLKDTANRKSILILKGSGGSKVRARVVNLTDINSLKTANLMIQPNDIVYVTPNDMKAFNIKIREIDPVFGLIGNILAPFVNIKFLSK